jgi:hypothetical protein
MKFMLQLPCFSRKGHHISSVRLVGLRPCLEMEKKKKINMARITLIAREAFVPSVKPAEDSIAIGHTGSEVAVT